MIKVLLVGPVNIKSGGIETYLLNTLSYICKDEIEIEMLVRGTIVSEEIEERFSKLGCSFKVLHIAENGIKEDIKYFRSLEKILSVNQYDVVHINVANLKPAAICLIAARRRNVAVRIVHFHATLQKGSFIKETVRHILRQIILKNAIDFLACSTAAAEALGGKKNKNKVKIAKNGIEVEKYSFNAETRNRIRAQYNWDNCFVIGIIARISQEKNHLFLLKVMKKLVEKNSRSLLAIVGTGDKAYECQVKNESERLSLQDHIQFLGEKNNVNELVQGMDLHVLPSIKEGLGIANIEAQTAGLHCICSDRVPREADVTGLVEFIPLEKSDEYWAEKIMQYDNEYERRDTSRMIITHGYDITNSAKLINQIYHESVVRQKVKEITGGVIRSKTTFATDAGCILCA